MDENLKSKIGKLLNMTVENGCTEDEQETALRMAAGLAAKAGIDLASIQAKTTAGPIKHKAKTKTLSQEWKIHQVLSAQAAAALYGTQVYAYAGGSQGLFFVGREELLDLTEQTMFWLMRQVELLYKENLPRGMTQKARAEYRKTFKAACANRVYQRARDLMREMKTNPAAALKATGQNALVVQGYFETLKHEIDEYFGSTPEQLEAARKREEDRRNALTPTQRAIEDAESQRRIKAAAKRKGPRPRYLPMGNGTNDGRAAGDTVKLRKELS